MTPSASNPSLLPCCSDGPLPGAGAHALGPQVHSLGCGDCRAVESGQGGGGEESRHRHASSSTG
jgi:hypothetical protein